MIRKPIMCHVCVHIGDELNFPGTSMTCQAYPGGIPDEILYQRFDHRNPAPDDNGIRFELDTEYNPLLIQQVFKNYDGK